MEPGNPSALIGTSSPTYPTSSAATARREMTERATAAQLRYLDQQQAGVLIATLRRHGHLPANHSLDGGPPRRQNSV